MKANALQYFLIILSLEFLFLSAIPCQDGFASDRIEHESDHHQDECSPFCVCQCCHIPVIQEIIATEFKPHKPLSEYQSIYIPYSSNFVMKPHFHPPRRI